MKGIKGRILRKIKCIPQLGNLKQGRVLHVHASNGFLDDPTPPDPKTGRPLPPSRAANQPDDIDILQLIRDLEGEEEAATETGSDKENIRPPVPPLTTTTVQELAWRKQSTETQLQEDQGGNQNSKCDEINRSLFRRPDLNSGTLFDPDLLAAFHQAVTDHIQIHEASRINKTRSSQEDDNLYQNEEPPSKIPRLQEQEPEEQQQEEDPLSAFEQRCPPGGDKSVILYTTTLRGVRKTFEDCNSVRFLLSSLKILFYERDVSMHLGFREELWSVLGRKVIPPRLFVRGRYVGGADEVLGLHERGSFRRLVEGVPADGREGIACGECRGFRFLMCCDCGGSRKVRREEDDGGRDLFVRCPRCNENGLVTCPVCC